MARTPKVEELPLFDAIAGLDTPPTDPDHPAADDTTPVALPEPTSTEAPVEARPERRRRVGRPARPPAAVLCVAAILTAAVTVGLLTRPGASSRPTPPRITAAIPPPVPAAPPPPRTRPRAVKPRTGRGAPGATRPAVVKPVRTLPPPRLSRQVARRPQRRAPTVGSAVGEFAP